MEIRISKNFTVKRKAKRTGANCGMIVTISVCLAVTLAVILFRIATFHVNPAKTAGELKPVTQAAPAAQQFAGIKNASKIRGLIPSNSKNTEPADLAFRFGSPLSYSLHATCQNSKEICFDLR